MKAVKQGGSEKGASGSAPPKRNTRKLMLFAIVPVVLAGAAATYFLVPALAETGHAANSQVQTKTAGTPAPAQAHPQMVDVPEIVVTLPNDGHPRQLRIKLSLELTPAPHDLPPMDQFTPKVNDALLTYLRTLRDSDLEGGLALDRIRGDLYRRLTLVLGPNVINNVLITSLVTG
ncbi:MAG: hypothetical protein B7Z80_25345 [Rhodospirillales bacterium 20-64-7]|nr:MAG: hypothetical protein B7Z80_25345 [Rhodospirillales bacterium 20-64-7]HQT75731.1 flagellar basal body-associated FliL family protein [Rhodopila sp.]